MPFDVEIPPSLHSDGHFNQAADDSNSFHRRRSEGDEHLKLAAKPALRHSGTEGALEPLFETHSGTFLSGEAHSHFAQVRRKASRSLLENESPESPHHQNLGMVTPKLSLFLGSRCTRVHFVRHAQGYHNVITHEAGINAKGAVEKSAQAAKVAALKDGQSQAEAEALSSKLFEKTMRFEENRPVHFDTAGAHRYTDAELTEAGRNQCYCLRGKMQRNLLQDPLHRTNIDLVVVSPLRRCLETADIIFGPGRGSQDRPELKPFLVHDLCRERYGEFYCDKRQSMTETRKDPRWSDWDWESQEVDWPDSVHPFSDADEIWAEERETEAHVHDRSMRFLEWLAKRPEREVAVVTHSSFLKNLFKVFGGDTCQDDQAQVWLELTQVQELLFRRTDFSAKMSPSDHGIPKVAIPPEKWTKSIYSTPDSGLAKSEAGQLTGMKFDPSFFGRAYTQCVGRGLSHKECVASLPLSDAKITAPGPLADKAANAELFAAIACVSQNGGDSEKCKTRFDALAKLAGYKEEVKKSSAEKATDFCNKAGWKLLAVPVIYYGMKFIKIK